MMDQKVYRQQLNDTKEGGKQISFPPIHQYQKQKELKYRKGNQLPQKSLKYQCLSTKLTNRFQNPQAFQQQLKKINCQRTFDMQKQQDLPEFRGNIGNIITQTDDAQKQMLAASAELKRQRQEYVFQQELFRNEVLQQVQIEIEQTEILQAQISQKLKNLKDFLRANNFHQQQAQLFDQMRDFRQRDYIGQSISEGIIAGGQLNQSYAGESNQLQEKSAAKILPNSPEVFQQQGRFQSDQIRRINLQQLRNCSSEEKQSKIDLIFSEREDNNQVFKIDSSQKILQLQPSPLLRVSSDCHSQTPNSFNHFVSFSHGTDLSRITSQNLDMNLAESRNFQKSQENIQQVQPLKDTHLEGVNTEISSDRQPSLQNKLFNPSCLILQSQEKPHQNAEKNTQKLSKIFPKIEESIDSSPFPQQVSCFEEQSENRFESEPCQKKLHVEKGQEQPKNQGQQKVSLAAMAPKLLPEKISQVNVHHNQAVSLQEINTQPAPLSSSVETTPDQILSFKMSKSFLKDINAIMPPQKRLRGSETPMNQLQISQQNDKIHDLVTSSEVISENGKAESFTGKQITEDNRQNQLMKDQTTPQTIQRNLNQTTNENINSLKRPTDHFNKSDSPKYITPQGETNQMKNLLKGFRRRMLRSFHDSTVKMDNFMEYFSQFTLGNELILNLLKEGAPYNKDFQSFLQEDPIWWIQEAKIQDVSRQINFVNKVLSKKYSKLKTKSKNKNNTEEQSEQHSNHSLNIRSSITLTDQMDERDNCQHYHSSQYSG